VVPVHLNKAAANAESAAEESSENDENAENL